MEKILDIELSFKDTHKRIKFNIDNNTVFYGVNGRGKTRILKSIYLIHKLIKENNFRDIVDIIEELNLDTLKLNDKDYFELIKNKDDFDDKKNSHYIKNFKEEIHFIKEYSSMFKNSINRLGYSSFPIGYHKDSEKLEKICQKMYSNDFNTEVKVFLFEEWMNISRKLTRFIEKKIIRNTENDIDNIKIENYVLNNIDFYNHFIHKLKYSINRLESQYRNTLKSSEDPGKDFENVSVRYIDSDLRQMEKVFDEIKDNIKKINECAIEQLWSNKDISMKEVKKTFFKLEHNLESVNKIISKYANIKVHIDLNGDVIFFKDNANIPYEKLSSGEKRIVLIFLNICLFEYDIILIDEPEVSLSLNYQTKIITDIHNQTTNKKVLIATHAPYIYKDFLDIEGNKKVEV